MSFWDEILGVAERVSAMVTPCAVCGASTLAVPGERPLCKVHQDEARAAWANEEAARRAKEAKRVREGGREPVTGARLCSICERRSTQRVDGYCAECFQRRERIQAQLEEDRRRLIEQLERLRGSYAKGWGSAWGGWEESAYWGHSHGRTSASAFEERANQADAWYVVLGCEPSASEAEIQKAWRAAARKAHPDLGGSHEAMLRVNAARDEGLRWCAA